MERTAESPATQPPCEELSVMAEEPLEIKDFSSITPWEKLVYDIEDVLSEWKALPAESSISFSDKAPTKSLKYSTLPILSVTRGRR